MKIFENLARSEFFNSIDAYLWITFMYTLFPMIVSIVIYALIGTKLHRMRSIGSNSTKDGILAKRTRTVKMLIVLMVTYYTLTLPISIKWTVEIMKNGTRDVCVKIKGAFGVKAVCMMMALLSTIVNPFILTYYNGTVKHQMSTIFCRRKQERHNSSRLEAVFSRASLHEQFDEVQFNSVS